MLKVLVVEDEELIRNEILLTTPWEKFSCEVIGSAPNGLIGEELIKSLHPDIVITDIRMPGKTGLEMLDSVPSVASLILTGHNDFSLMQDAIRLGVKEYILKPVDDSEFYKALERITSKLLENEVIKNIEKSSATPFKEYINVPHGNRQDFYIDMAIEYITNFYCNNISLSDAASSIGITGSYLSRLFKTKTSYSFLEYLRYYRIKKALELMKDQSLKINEVARETGFNDMSYFSETFKKYMGVSPSSYINGLNDTTK